jgi:hypothetical protein
LKGGHNATTVMCGAVLGAFPLPRNTCVRSVSWNQKWRREQPGW